MIDKKAFTNFCTGMNFNPCCKRLKEENKRAATFTFFFPEFMCHTMHDQSMNTWIVVRTSKVFRAAGSRANTA
jgi:hypothetical protein